MNDFFFEGRNSYPVCHSEIFPNQENMNEDGGWSLGEEKV